MESDNKLLGIKIENFRSFYLNKFFPLKIEPNKFDILIDKLILAVLYVYNSIINKIIFLVMNFIKNINNFIFSIKDIEKKIKKQDRAINETIQLNNNLLEQIRELNNKINYQKYSSNKNEEVLSKDNSEILIKNDNFEEKNSEINFFQNENLRLSKELFDVKKKVEIMKQEIEKFEEQRSNLVTKINSVNDVIKDTNVLTNVFENSVKIDKVEIKDYKIEKRKTEIKDLSVEVEKIFAKK